MRWIDTHTHIFTQNTSLPAGEMPEGRLHDVAAYRQSFGQMMPQGVIVVHFSQAPDNAHVFAALAELKAQKIPARGILKALPQVPEVNGLSQPEIAGFRFYALKDAPNLRADWPIWQRNFNHMRHHGQHILLFGRPGYLRQLIDQLPDDLPLAIDHLGLPFVGESLEETEWKLLVRDAASRNRTAGPVYVKGPGYRTALKAAETYPYLQEWLEHLGADRILLGASDAPFAGAGSASMPHGKGQPFRQLITHQSVVQYLQKLAELATKNSQTSDWTRNALLYSNAAELYGFQQTERQAATA